jgi:hypothetical protein
MSFVFQIESTPPGGGGLADPLSASEGALRAGLFGH